MNCSVCSAELDEGAQFCGICGTSLTSGETSSETEQPIVGFGEAISRGYKNYLKFSGRATRAEFWWFQLFYYVVILGGILLGGVIHDSVMFLILVFAVLSIIPDLSLSVRRLHDCGNSGWLILVGLVPLVGELIMLVLYCRQRQQHRNTYGPDPRTTAS